MEKQVISERVAGSYNESVLKQIFYPILCTYPVLIALWGVLTIITATISLKLYLAQHSNAPSPPNRQISFFEEDGIKSNYSYRLIFFFFLYSFSQVLSLTLSTIYFYRKSIYQSKTFNLAFFERFIHSISQCILYCSLLMLAQGWCILSEVNSSEFRILSSSLFALLSSHIFFSFYDIIASLLVLYVFLLPILFSSITQNIECLHFRIMWMEAVKEQIQDSEYEGWEWSFRSLTSKFIFFRRIRLLFFIYFSLLLCSNIVSSVLPHHLDYLIPIILEILIILFISLILYLLSPRHAKNGLFWYDPRVDGSESHTDWIEATQRILERVLFF